MSNPACRPATQPAREAFTHTIDQGDCISKLAEKHGHFPDTIWQDDGNADLRRERDDMNILLPGDEIHIPAIRAEQHDGDTEKRHRFRRKGVPAKFKVRMMALGEPHADVPYQIKIDGTLGEGQTDGDGYLEEWIAPTAQVAEVTLQLPEREERYVFQLGHQDPIDQPSGVQQRLRNLGFEVEVTERLDDQTRDALTLFQQMNDLDPTGEIDDATKSKLDELHGT